MGEQELYKFIPKQYNPKFGHKYIKLGTLLHYREMEGNVNIADKNEGVSRISIGDYDSNIADPELKNNIPFGLGNFKLGDIAFESIFPNCYIYCLSMNKNKDIKGKQFCDDYDSHFIIKDLNGFISVIRESLQKEIRIKHFEESAIKSIKDKSSFFRDLELRVLGRPVQYSGNKSLIVENSKVLNNHRIPTGLEIAFLKDKKYFRDQEYRIAFIFVYRNQIVPVKKDPIRVKCKNLPKYIK